MDYSYFSDKRQLFFNFLEKFIPNFKNCNSERQFLDLLSTSNEIILSISSWFVICIHSFGFRFAELLYSEVEYETGKFKSNSLVF